MSYQKGPSTYHHEPVEYWLNPPSAVPSLWWEIETDFGDGAVEMRECTREVVADGPPLPPPSKVQHYVYGQREDFKAEGWLRLGPIDAALLAEKARERAAAKARVATAEELADHKRWEEIL